MPSTVFGAQSTQRPRPERAVEPEQQLPNAACGESAPLSHAVAWLAAGVGMSLFAFAGAALVAHSVTLEYFWVLSAIGLVMYVSAYLWAVRATGRRSHRISRSSRCADRERIQT